MELMNAADWNRFIFELVSRPEGVDWQLLEHLDMPAKSDENLSKLERYRQTRPTFTDKANFFLEKIKYLPAKNPKSRQTHVLKAHNL